MTVVKEFFEGMYDLLMYPVDATVHIINNIGIQRIAAISSLFAYLYLQIMGMEVTAGMYGVVATLNGLHAAKSIYGKGVEKGMNGLKKE